MAIAPITPDASVGVISFYDTAIDHEGSEKKSEKVEGKDVEVTRYFAERIKRPAAWRDSVKFKDGERPTVFVIGVIPSSELTRIEDECGIGGTSPKTRELYWRCFLAGLRDIENGPTAEVQRDGRMVREAPKVKVDGVPYVDPSWLRSTFVRSLRSVAIDIGQTVYWWNQLQDDDIKN